MEKIKIVIRGAVIWETGHSAVITIPKTYLHNGMVELGQEYDVSIQSSRKSGGSKK